MPAQSVNHKRSVDESNEGGSIGWPIHHSWYASACELTIPSTRSYPNKWEPYQVIEIHLILVQSCQKSILEIASLLLTVMWISQQIGESWIYFFVTHLYKWELNLIDLVDFEPGSTHVPNDFESEGTSDNAWSDNSLSDVGATLEEDHQNQHMSPGLSDMPVSPSVQDFFATTTSRFYWWYF